MRNTATEATQMVIDGVRIGRRNRTRNTRFASRLILFQATDDRGRARHTIGQDIAILNRQIGPLGQKRQGRVRCIAQNNPRAIMPNRGDVMAEQPP